MVHPAIRLAIAVDKALFPFILVLNPSSSQTLEHYLNSSLHCFEASLLCILFLQLVALCLDLIHKGLKVIAVVFAIDVSPDKLPAELLSLAIDGSSDNYVFEDALRGDSDDWHTFERDFCLHDLV